MPETSRWSYIQQHPKQGDIAIKIDSALTDVEKSNALLKGATKHPANRLKGSSKNYNEYEDQSTS